MAYGPKITIRSDTKERTERGLTAREITDRDAARAANDVLATQRETAKQSKRDDLAALATATPDEVRDILVRVLR